MIFRRSLISELTNAAGGVFTVLFSIVLTVGVVRAMTQISGGKIDAGSFLYIVLFSSLQTLGPLLALSLFLAVLMALIRGWQQNEMIVWFSSGGLSLLSWIRPVLRVAFPVIIVVAVVSIFITPWAYGQMEVQKSHFTQRDDTSRIASGQFVESGSGRRVFFIEQVDEEAGNVKGIFMSEASKGGKTKVLAASEGKLFVNKEGDRFAELKNGRQYEIGEGGKSYRVTDFDRYGIRLDVKPDLVLGSDKANAIPVQSLLENPTPKNMGQIFWRLSWPFVALNLALLAIPLSVTNPRAGRSLNIVAAVLVFILYLNFISIMQSWITEEKWHWWTGLVALHGTVLALTAALFVRQIWFQRWLPKQLSLGYWLDRAERGDK